MQSSFIVHQYKKKLLIYNTFNEVDDAQNRKTSQLEEGLSFVQVIIKKNKNNGNNAAISNFFNGKKLCFQSGLKLGTK